MRSAEKIGVLPPDLAYRGHDGFYVGDGVHLPWKDRGARESLDLRGGAYLVGGVVADVRLLTPVGTTKVRWDRLRGQDGLQIDARGATESVAWDADVLRGRRAVVMTTNLDAAAKPYDRASAAAALDADPIVAQAGYRAITRRGGDLERIDVSGPFVALRSSGGTAPGPLQATWDATLEGGALTSLRVSTLSYARGELGGLATTRFGPVVTSLSARGAGALANDADRSGTDASGSARLRFGFPLARAYAKKIERGNDTARVPSDVSARLERMEQAIDSIAVEVERISEGQRFTTKLLAERSGAAVGGDVSPPGR
jgi:hypothetical protein